MAALSDPRPGGGSTRTVAGLCAGPAETPPEPVPTETEKGARNARCLHEGVAGGWRPLRPPDAPLEPEDEAIHLHRTRRHLHHRPPADPAAARRGVRIRTGGRP